MAITKAQQARQMLKAGGGMLVSPSNDGRRPGYAAAPGSRMGSGEARESRGENVGGGNRDREGPSREQFKRQTSLPSTKPKAPPGRDPDKRFEPFKPSTKPKDKPDIIKPKPKPPKKTNFRELFRGLFPTTTSIVNAINKFAEENNIEVDVS